MEVVLVARQPEVFVHGLEPEQAQRLVKITRSTRDRVRLRRARDPWSRLTATTMPPIPKLIPLAKAASLVSRLS